MQFKKLVYVDLPEGIQNPKANVTADNRIGIEYTIDISIPKPEPLIGGTEVYQKEGSPYWYCKIKDGKEEFMHLETSGLTYSRRYYHNPMPKNLRLLDGGQLEYEFELNGDQAIKNQRINGIWIPTNEPSISTSGDLQFIEGKEPLVGIECTKWEELIKNYSPQNESFMLTKDDYFLVLLRWLQDKFCTIEDVLVDSSPIGNFYSMEQKNEMELTGTREFGGLCGFAGNTRKIVKESTSKNAGFLCYGGSYYDHGCWYPIASLRYKNFYVNSKGKVKVNPKSSHKLRAMINNIIQHSKEPFYKESVALMGLRK